MASFNILFAALAVLLFATQGHAWRVWLYRDSGHRGGHIEMSGDGCVNVPDDFNDQATSVNTHGGCVRLYQNGGCSGRSIEVYPGTGAHDNLGFHDDFNDRTSSVGPCRSKRSVEYKPFQ
ncbi:hypothetical protein WDU94_010236 [Cyamophila willieti]